jgi:hypothetical protein
MPYERSRRRDSPPPEAGAILVRPPHASFPTRRGPVRSSRAFHGIGRRPSGPSHRMPRPEFRRPDSRCRCRWRRVDREHQAQVEKRSCPAVPQLLRTRQARGERQRDQGTDRETRQANRKPSRWRGDAQVFSRTSSLPPGGDREGRELSLGAPHACRGGFHRCLRIGDFDPQIVAPPERIAVDPLRTPITKKRHRRRRIWLYRCMRRAGLEPATKGL